MEDITFDKFIVRIKDIIVLIIPQVAITNLFISIPIKDMSIEFVYSFFGVMIFLLLYFLLYWIIISKEFIDKKNLCSKWNLYFILSFALVIISLLFITAFDINLFDKVLKS